MPPEDAEPPELLEDDEPPDEELLDEDEELLLDELDTAGGIAGHPASAAQPVPVPPIQE